MSECDGLREAMIDALLDQGEEGDDRRVAVHVESCARCRAEQAALRETIRIARSEPRLVVSPRFKGDLTARLDAVDRRERTAATVTLEIARHRLRRMPTALKVAAALLPFAIGAAWLLTHGGASTDEGPSGVVKAPRPGEGRREAPHIDAPRPRTEFPLPPDRSTNELDPPSPSLLEELVGAPRATPPDGETNKVAGGEAPAPAQPQQGEPNPDAERIWKQRQPIDLPSPKKPEPSKPTAAAPATASPVALALDWLVRTQRPNGSWAPGEGGEPGIDTGISALALLAFISEGCLGAGDEPADDLRARAAKSAADWLFAQQSPEGSFVGGRDDAARIFCHAVSCLALVERHARLLADGSPARDSGTAREHDPLELALKRLEGDLERLRHPGANDPAVARCAGQNAAWAAVALATARNCGVDFHLKPTGDRLIEEVLMRLRNEQPELIVATSHAIDAMAERTRGPADEAWRRAVEKVLKDPVAIEPSLRFLVATTLASTRRGRPDSAKSYAEFEARLDRALLSLQSPAAGWFDSRRRWDYFGGGPTYETSLAVLSLSVSERADEFAAIRAKLTARLPAPKNPKNNK